MPGVGSWNGKWTGEDRVHAVVKNVGASKKAKEKYTKLLGDYLYRWEDGWCARISVKEVDSAQARTLRKKSSGFCGYDWMINSIIDYGEIKTTYVS